MALFRSSPMFDTIEVVRETDWLREECIEDEREELRRCPDCGTRGDHYCPSDVDRGETDLCFHGLPKDGTCIDCKEESADDPDFNLDFGFPR